MKTGAVAPEQQNNTEAKEENKVEELPPTEKLSQRLRDIGNGIKDVTDVVTSPEFAMAVANFEGQLVKEELEALFFPEKKENESDESGSSELDDSISSDESGGEPKYKSNGIS